MIYCSEELSSKWKVWKKKLGLYRKFQERQLDFEEALNIIADAPLAESEKKKIFRLLSRMHYQD